MNSADRIKTLSDRIQKLGECYYGTIIDILIQHRCVINETTRGSNKGVSVIMDFVPEAALVELEKRVHFIENIETTNLEIENARIELNRQNPENTVDNGPMFDKLDTGEHGLTPVSHPMPLPKKISYLKIKLYQNNKGIRTQRSTDCFWCSMKIDHLNHVCIPTRLNPVDDPGIIDDDRDGYEVEGYGSFCRPECAAGYLLNENIDTSLKMERYMLLNQVYINQSGSISHGITPAVSPHYVMDKFMGTLTPVEYLAMTEQGTMYHTLKKPYTHILPELHEKYMIEHG